MYARVLGPDKIGSFFLFQALLGISAIPANFGVNPAVAKRVSEGKHASRVLTTALLLKFFPILFVSTVIYVFSARINRYVGLEVASLLVLGILIQESGRVVMKTLEGELRVGETSLIRFIDRSFWVVGGAVFVFYGAGVRGVVIGLLLGKMAALVIGVARTDATLEWPSLEVARSLFDFSKYSLVTNVGGYFYNWMDVLVIGFFIGQAAVGVYEVAWRVTGITILFSSAISTSIFPEISRLDIESDGGRIEKLLPRAITPSLFFIIPSFAGIALLSREILTYVFGTSYGAGWIVLIILMGDKVAQGFQLVLGKALQALDKPDKAAIAAVLSLAVNLILNILLVWQFGIVGAAVGTVIASLTNDILHYWFLSNHLTISVPYRELGWCISASLTMVAILASVKWFVDIQNLYLLLIVVGLGVLVYLPVALSHPDVRSVMWGYLH